MRPPRPAPWIPLLGSAALLLLSCSAEAPRPRHLLLITVDTLRADFLGAYGNPLGLTPNLDRLAAESLQFRAAYASAPFTMPSVASLMTGRYPHEIGVLSNLSRIPPTVPRLAELFRAAGWRTGAVVSNFVLRPESGLDAGFEHYDPLPKPRSERKAEATSDAALALLETLRGGEPAPFFLWVHYMDPHGPYTPPRALRQRFLVHEIHQPRGLDELPIRPLGLGGIPTYQYLPPARRVAYYRAGYTGEVQSTDAQIGRLLGAFAAPPLLDTTVILFAADHGESLGEDDYWFAHGELLNQASVHIPLLLRIPGRAPERRTDVVSLVDLLPTLAALFGLEREESGTPGRDLLARGARRRHPAVLFSTFSAALQARRMGIVEGNHKVVRTFVANGAQDALYRLSDASREVASAEPELRERLGRALDAYLARIPPIFQPQKAGLSPAEREHLRALGYVR